MIRSTIEYHPTFGYRYIPGVRARVEHPAGSYLVRANQSGFRCDHEFVPEKQPGTFRVLLFGDSFTAGESVSNAHRCGEELERRLPGLEVFNYGLDASGTDQHYLVFREMAQDIEHDLIVIGVFIPDIRRNVSRFQSWGRQDGRAVTYAKPYFLLGEDGLELRHVPVPADPIDRESLGPQDRDYLEAYLDMGAKHLWLRRKIGRLGRRVKSLAQQASRYQPVPGYDRPDHPQWLLMRRILLDWVSEARAPVILFLIPSRHFVDEAASPKGYQARFGELSDPPQLTVVDALPELLKYPRSVRRELRFPNDGHPTSEGHRVLADALEPSVRALMTAGVR